MAPIRRIIIQIKYSTEQEDGTYVMQASLTGKELDLVVEVGLNYLMAQGAFPFVSEEKADASGVPHDTPAMEQ